MSYWSYSISLKSGTLSYFEIHNSKRFFIMIISIHNGVGIIESQSWNWQGQWRCSYNTLIRRNYGHRRFYFDYEKNIFRLINFPKIGKYKISLMLEISHGPLEILYFMDIDHIFNNPYRSTLLLKNIIKWMLKLYFSGRWSKIHNNILVRVLIV